MGQLMKIYLENVDDKVLLILVVLCSNSFNIGSTTGSTIQ